MCKVVSRCAPALMMVKNNRNSYIIINLLIMKNNVQNEGLTLLQRVIAITLLCFMGCVASDVYHYNKGVELQKRIDSLNARIYELNEIGYTIEASKKIALVEFGFLPADYEYNALIED